MADKDRDIERAIEPRDTNPSTGADDRVEQVRGADDEADEFDVGEDEEEMDEDEEHDQTAI